MIPNFLGNNVEQKPSWACDLPEDVAKLFPDQDGKYHAQRICSIREYIQDRFMIGLDQELKEKSPAYFEQMSRFAHLEIARLEPKEEPGDCWVDWWGGEHVQAMRGGFSLVRNGKIIYRELTWVS